MDVCTPTGEIVRHILSKANVKAIPPLYVAIRKTSWYVLHSHSLCYHFISLYFVAYSTFRYYSSLIDHFLIYYWNRGGLFPYLADKLQISPFSNEGAKRSSVASENSLPRISESDVVPLRSFGEKPDENYVKDRENFLANGFDPSAYLNDITKSMSSKTSSSSSSRRALLRTDRSSVGEKGMAVTPAVGPLIEERAPRVVGRKRPTRVLRRVSDSDEDLD